MKKLALMVACAGLLVSGCGGSSDSEASSTTTTTTAAPSSQPKTVRNPQAFIAEFNSRNPTNVPLATVGNYVCDSLDANHAPDSISAGIYQYLQESVVPDHQYLGWTPVDAAFLFHGAIRNMCPEYLGVKLSSN